MENGLKLNNQEKELLLKDLCSRLPYKVKIQCINSDNETVIEELFTIGIEEDTFDCNLIEYVAVKPYLLPLSSMTEEQLYNNPVGFSQMLTIKADRDWENITINRRDYYKLVDWFNKNHFDYRGLIEKGLAIDATGLNIY